MQQSTDDHTLIEQWVGRWNKHKVWRKTVQRWGWAHSSSFLV